ncbi:hypothetical protein FIU82_05120 [Pseudoalteromonas sp. THAF3]|nr:hypothetical protein FIU82_05120 [Pseudoalteromonas sp. THAF3]
MLVRTFPQSKDLSQNLLSTPTVSQSITHCIPFALLHYLLYCLIHDNFFNNTRVSIGAWSFILQGLANKFLNS